MPPRPFPSAVWPRPLLAPRATFGARLRLAVLATALAAADSLAQEAPSPAQDPACVTTVSPEIVAEATRLHELGQQARARGDWATALTFYLQSQRLDPSTPTQARVGECLERQGSLLAALEAYRGALPLVCRLNVELQAASSARLSEIIAGIEQRLPSVSLRVVGRAFEHTLELDQHFIDGTEVSTPVALDPGSHNLTLRAEGYAETHCAFQVAERERLEIRLTRAERPSNANACQSEGTLLRVTLLPNPEPEPPASKPPKQESASPARRWAGFTLAGAGAIGLGIGAYFGVRTLSLVSSADCDDNPEGGDRLRCSEKGTKTIHQASRTETAGFVAAGVGAGLVAAGVAVLVVPLGSSDSSSAARASLLVTASGTVVGVQGSW